MTEAQLKRLIYLKGMRPDYTVVTSAFDGQPDIGVTTAGIGNAIVRALRQHAKAMLSREGKKPIDLFPPSILAKAAERMAA